MTGATFPDLHGASVFLTGGGAGIGAELTRGFCAQGARVAFVQRSDATALCNTIEADTGNRPLYLPCDVTDIAALEAAIARAAEAHGPASVLVAAAADDARCATLEADEAFFDASVDVNLKHYFFAARAVIPAMRDARRGSIVLYSSISYMMGAAGYPVYMSCNAAINALARSLAREFGPDGIRVNALLPGWVMTDRQQDLWVTPEGLAAHLERQCLKDPLTPADMVEPTLFLASSASRAMTGQALVVDGGVVGTG